MTNEQLEQFMRESNWIEGERTVTMDEGTIGILHKNDLSAAAAFLAEPMTEKSLKKLHYDLSEGRPIKRGEWRDCDVQVGSYIAPEPALVPKQMKTFIRQLPMLDAWEAHNIFEKIHPWQDLNGRTGRLIWLHKMEGETELPFLHRYYYQTLAHSNL